jgi:hypothetical protein
MLTTDTDPKSADPKSADPKSADPKGPDSKVAALPNNPESKNALLSWLQKLWRDHLTTPQLQEIPKVGSFQWIFLLLTASILIVIPFVLAYVTSFYTPTIGLSCRTFTFVLYFIFQSLLTMVWLYDFVVNDHEGANKSIFVYFLAWLFFGGSCFTAIIGTFMQIVGVYRNCLCNIPMGYWGSRDFHFAVSTNTADGIYYAGLYWLSTGIASIGLLIIFCYFGWWYQRHWRSRFDDVVDNILDVKPVIKPSTKTGDEKGFRERHGFRATKGKNGSTVNLGNTTSTTTPAKDGSATIPGKDGSATIPGKDGSATIPGKDGSTANLGNTASTTTPAKDGSATIPGKDGSATTPGNDGRATTPGNDGRATTPGNDGSTATPEKGKTANGPEPMGTIPKPAQNNPPPGQDATAPTAGKPGEDVDAIGKVR